MTDRSTIEQLIDAFEAALELPRSEIGEGLTYETHSKWDSTAHMMLIARLEESFSVMFDVDDIINMNSFKKAQELISACDPNIQFGAGI